MKRRSLVLSPIFQTNHCKYRTPKLSIRIRNWKLGKVWAICKCHSVGLILIRIKLLAWAVCVKSYLIAHNILSIDHPAFSIPFELMNGEAAAAAAHSCICVCVYEIALSFAEPLNARFSAPSSSILLNVISVILSTQQLKWYSSLCS